LQKNNKRIFWKKLIHKIFWIKVTVKYQHNLYLWSKKITVLHWCMLNFLMDIHFLIKYLWKKIPNKYLAKENFMNLIMCIYMMKMINCLLRKNIKNFWNINIVIKETVMNKNWKTTINIGQTSILMKKYYNKQKIWFTRMQLIENI
jgi:hypothetical protein